MMGTYALYLLICALECPAKKKGPKCNAERKFISWLPLKKEELSAQCTYMENKPIYEKRIKTEHMSVTMGPTMNIFYILYLYSRLDGMSKKTISRYCPFKVKFIHHKKVDPWMEFVILCDRH